MQIFANTNYNFIRWRIHALVLSWCIVLAGAVDVYFRGLPLGVEFSGGTIVICQFEQEVGEDQVRRALDQQLGGLGQNSVVQRYGDAAARQIMVRVPEVGAESGGALSQTADSVVKALKAANLGGFTVVQTEIVGPVVGKDLTRKGLLATGLSLLGILAYVAFRYQLSFAVGAVVATLHDLFVTLAFVVFFRYDLSLNVVAAILTITGYSVNDTIVIFDRVRENMRSMRRDNLDVIVNRAVNQTMSRTALTAGLTLLSVVALYLFGGEVLRGFAFTMIVGIITGTYSSIFIAAAIVTLWHSAARKKNTSAPTATVRPEPAAPPEASRSKKAGKVRAS